jgi:hypothetical protein
MLIARHLDDSEKSPSALNSLTMIEERLESVCHLPHPNDGQKLSFSAIVGYLHHKGIEEQLMAAMPSVPLLEDDCCCNDNKVINTDLNSEAETEKEANG